MSGNEKGTKKEFVIPVSWEVYSTITVSASSLEEALDWAERNQEDLPLPTDSKRESHRVGSDSYDADVDLTDDREMD